MRFEEISGKLVNVDNILYVNALQNTDTGNIICHFILKNDIVLTEVYQDDIVYRMSLEKYGIIKVNWIEKIMKNFYVKIISKILKRAFIKRIK